MKKSELKQRIKEEFTKVLNENKQQVNGIEYLKYLLDSSFSKESIENIKTNSKLDKRNANFYKINNSNIAFDFREGTNNPYKAGVWWTNGQDYKLVGTINKNNEFKISPDGKAAGSLGAKLSSLENNTNESLDTVGSDILKKITGEEPKTASKNTFRTPSYISNIDGGPSVTTIDKYYTLEDYIEEFKSKYGEEPTFDKSGKQYGKVLWKPTNPKFLEAKKLNNKAVSDFGTEGD